MESSVIELSKIIRAASENREKADYLDFFIASKDEAEKQIERANIFSKYITEYLIEKSVDWKLRIFF